MKRTSALWYLVALLLALGGSMTAAAVAASDWNDLETSQVIPINSGRKVDVTGKGVAFFTDFKQDRNVTCRSTPDKALTIKDATNLDVQTESGERIWHLVGRTVDAKAGSYDVACTPRDRKADTATYGYTELPAFTSASAGKGIQSMAVLAAVILAGWCWWGRRSDRKLATS